MAERQWIPRREEPRRRRATMSFSGKDEGEGESPDAQVARPRASASRFSIGNPARGSIDFGGFVKPRLNPEYDESLPIEQRAQPYREAGFFRRMFGDTANESNAEFAAKQQDLLFKTRAAELAHQLRMKEIERAGGLDAENMQYRMQTQANIDAINDARRFGQQRELASMGQQHDIELEGLRGRRTGDETLLGLAAKFAPELVPNLTSYPDDPMVRGQLSELSGQRFGEERAMRQRAADLEAQAMQLPRVVGDNVITWGGGVDRILGGEINPLTMQRTPMSTAPVVVPRERLADIYQGTPGSAAPANIPAAGESTGVQTDQPWDAVTRVPQSQAVRPNTSILDQFKRTAETGSRLMDTGRYLTGRKPEGSEFTPTRTQTWLRALLNAGREY